MKTNVRDAHSLDAANRARRVGLYCVYGKDNILYINKYENNKLQKG
nr:MAG TPA: UvrABC system protein C [Bacteriophage sp.]